MFFRSGSESLFGWLHATPDARSTRIGIVLCKPFGYESMCADSSVRALAEACASAGVTVLRFDYRGTGDSSGEPTEDDQILSWCADIQAAAQALQAHAGVDRVGLLGIRLGATLAALVAASDPNIKLNIAVAPIVNGRRYLRELRAFQASSSSEALATRTDVAAMQMETSRAGLEVTGYRLSQASVDHLATLDLASTGGHSIPDAVIIDNLDSPAASSWADALRARGTRVLYRALSGIPSMITAPHIAVVPQQIVGSVQRFLEGYATTAQGPAYRRPAPISTPCVCMELSTSEGERLLERATIVDGTTGLFAIVTHAVAHCSSAPRAGAILLNCGANSHVGPNRLYVDLARDWAARGYCVLRLDLQGLGDSAALAADGACAAYPPHAIEDVGRAIEFLRREYGTDHVTLVGMCSGAYHALRSATAGLNVNTVLLINPLTFYWKQGSQLSDLQDAEVVRNPVVYAAHVLSLAHWRKLLLARVNVLRVASIFLRRLALSLTSHARDLGRSLRIRLPGDLGWELQALKARGVRVVFLFARADSGRDLLRLQAGSALKTSDGHCRILIVDGADHTFTQRGPRLELQRLLTAELPHRSRADVPEHPPANVTGPGGQTASVLLQTRTR